MAERINHKLMRCECRCFLPTPTVSCQFATFLAILLLLLLLFVPGSFFISPFCAFSADQTQNSLTLGCLACKCHFSVQITQFITFHLTRLDSTHDSRVKQSKSPTENSPSSIYISISILFFILWRMCFQFGFLSKLAVGVFNGFFFV